jgi:hypothetical protein
MQASFEHCEQGDLQATRKHSSIAVRLDHVMDPVKSHDFHTPIYTQITKIIEWDYGSVSHREK